MPRDSITVREPIHLEDHLGDGTAPLMEVFDAIVRDQIVLCERPVSVAAGRHRRSGFAAPRLAEMEADLHQLLDELDEELQVLSTRLDRALSR